MALPDDVFATAESVQEVVGMAVGAGSMCWENVRGAGVFQSEQASDIVDKAVARILEITAEYRGLRR